MRSKAISSLILSSCLLVPVALGGLAHANSFAPPMLDINKQCAAASRRNVTAMSECIVAESEARSELLQKWEKVPDAAAEKCIKFGRKAKRQPYVAMVKCLNVEVPPAPVAPPKT